MRNFQLHVDKNDEPKWHPRYDCWSGHQFPVPQTDTVKLHRLQHLFSRSKRFTSVWLPTFPLIENVIGRTSFGCRDHGSFLHIDSVSTDSIHWALGLRKSKGLPHDELYLPQKRQRRQQEAPAQRKTWNLDSHFWNVLFQLYWTVIVGIILTAVHSGSSP